MTAEAPEVADVERNECRTPDHTRNDAMTLDAQFS